MDFDVRDPAFEAGEALPDLLFDAVVALCVACDLIVGMDLDEQGFSPRGTLWSYQCRGTGAVPLAWKLVADGRAAH
jgi:hypothetical protein